MQRSAIGMALNARRLARSLPLFGAAALFAPLTQAQDAASHGTTVTPSFSAQETLTNNVNLSATDPRWDAITQVSPGISLSSRSGRVRGSLAYTANALAYARDSSRNTIQNALTATGNAEVIENHAFVDANATISQQAISAFGPQSTGTGLLNSNSTEVYTASVSPSLRGHLGSAVDAQARVTWSATHAASAGTGNSTGMSAMAGLSGGRSRVGWSLTATRQVSGFTGGRKTTDDNIFAGLSLQVDPSLQLSARAGHQTNDILTYSRQHYRTYGWGANWRPGPRTTLALQSDHQYFGNSHSLSFQHRMKRSIWTYSDSRGVSGNPAQAAVSQPVSLYELLFAEFASIQPDPVLRDQLVRAYLQANGLDPNPPSQGGFLSSALAVQRRQNLSVALTGLRDTVTLSAFRTQTSQLAGVTYTTGDLAQGEPVRQLGYSIGLAHRLTPDSSLNLSASKLKTLSAGTLPGSDQRTALLTWAGTLSRRTTGTLSLRRTLFGSANNPYNESALIGTISLRF